jgi:hypothetical protein
MEDAMYFDLTSSQVIIDGSVLAFAISAAFATFLDIRWNRTLPIRALGSVRDDNDAASNLYARHADLSVSCLGTAAERITFRVKTRQN